MKNNTTKNTAILLISTVFGIITQLSQFVLLGRFLSSEQIGIASIVLVIIMFAQMFTDFGLSGYYIHRQKVIKSERSTLFWLNLALGILIALFVAVFSPVIAWFYGQDELIILLFFSALSFPIIALGSQFQASLLKRFLYKKIVFIEVSARIVGLLVFSASIYFDSGPACVVMSHLALCITKTLLLFCLIERKEYPSFEFEYNYAQGGLKFGVYLILGQFLNQIMMNLDKILIGKFLGMSNLGIYTLAKDLAARTMLVVNPIVNKLCLPKYASIQHDKKLLANEVGQTFVVLGFFSSFMFFSLSITSELVVFLMYGSGNEMTGDILKILAFYMLFRSFSNVISTLLNSVGNTKLDFKWQCVSSLIGMPSIYFLVQYDMITMVTGMVFLQFLFVVVSYFFSLKPIIPLSFIRYMRSTFIFPVIGLISLYPLSFYQDSVDFINVIVSYLSWLFCYLTISLLLFKSPLKKYI